MIMGSQPSSRSPEGLLKCDDRNGRAFLLIVDGPQVRFSSESVRKVASLGSTFMSSWQNALSEIITECCHSPEENASP